MKRSPDRADGTVTSTSSGSSRVESDTPEDVEAIFYLQVAAMTPLERALVADRLSRDAIAAARADIIAGGWFETSEQVHREFVKRLDEEALADEYFANLSS